MKILSTHHSKGSINRRTHLMNIKSLYISLFILLTNALVGVQALHADPFQFILDTFQYPTLARNAAPVWSITTTDNTFEGSAQIFAEFDNGPTGKPRFQTVYSSKQAYVPYSGVQNDGT